MTLNEIVRACRGSFGYPADIEITEISADTRTIRPGSVFIALKGERYDGNDFALEAMEKVLGITTECCFLQKATEEAFP